MDRQQARDLDEVLRLRGGRIGSIIDRTFMELLMQTAQHRVVFHPTKDRVLVKADATQEKTAGGIYVPEQAKSRPRRGTVLAVGPEVLAEATSRVRPGARVLYGKYSGGEVNVNSEELLIMRLDEVLGVEEPVNLEAGAGVAWCGATLPLVDGTSDRCALEAGHDSDHCSASGRIWPDPESRCGAHVATVNEYEVAKCDLAPGHAGPCSHLGRR